MKYLENGRTKYNILEKPFSKLGNHLHEKHWERFFEYYDSDDEKLTHGLGVEKYQECMESAQFDANLLFNQNGPFHLLFTMINFHVRVFFSLLGKIVIQN